MAAKTQLSQPGEPARANPFLLNESRFPSTFFCLQLLRNTNLERSKRAELRSLRGPSVSLPAKHPVTLRLIDSIQNDDLNCAKILSERNRQYGAR
jgi:hypothetical protein